MSYRSIRWLVFALALFPATAHAQEATRKKPIAIEDLYLIDSVQSVARLPDGEKLIYERVWIDPKTKAQRHALWIGAKDHDKRMPLEAGEPDGRAPVVSPDGKWLAFLSARKRPAQWKQTPPVPPYSDAAVDIWMIPTGGGKAIPLGGPEKRHGRVFHDGFYGRVAFSPDGGRLVFVADMGEDPRTAQEIANNVTQVRADQGEGYTGYGPACIWIANLLPSPAEFAAKHIELLTKDTDQVWYGDPQWSPDGKTIVVHANKSNDRESVRFSINRNFDLWAIDASTGKQKQLTSNPGPDVSPRFSADGKRIAYLSVPRKGAHREIFNLGVVTLGDDGPKARIVFDHHERKAKEKRLAPAFPLPRDCWVTERTLQIMVEEGTQTRYRNIRIDSGAEAEPQGERLVQQVHDALMMPPVSRFLDDRLLAKQELVHWENEGLELEGIFTRPPPEVAKPPYKLIVYPHGGPHSRSTLGFDFTPQVFAAHGYAVFQPNFRGSSGYDQKFIDADRFDLGGGDMRDILTGIDKLVKENKVDPKRQFVYGISYGGFMATWLVGQTDQFRAVAAQNAVTDMNMMWGLSDIPSWTQWELGGLPWEKPDVYRKHSPLTHVAKVKTPTLILHARDDRRCPVPMGRAYHQALRALSVPTEMVIYPNEGHGIRQPRHREDVYRRVLAWFAKYD